MIGLPYEQYDDIKGIADLSEKVVECFYKNEKTNKRRGVQVTISVASFVPKPFTPFQWAAQDSVESLCEKQKFLKGEIKNRHVRYNYHQSDVSVLEGVFARGDRRLCNVLLRAHELGCKLDGWNECFRYDLWLQAFKDCGIDPCFYTRARSYDEILPWDFIDIGVTRKFMENENEKAKSAVTTPNCREKCSGCGAKALCSEKEGCVCFE